MAVSSVTAILRRAARRAGLVDKDGSPVVSLRGLRHTAASVAIARGVPLTTVAAQLGHRDTVITQRVYAHLLGDQALDAFADAQSDAALPGRPINDESR